VGGPSSLGEVDSASCSLDEVDSAAEEATDALTARHHGAAAAAAARAGLRTRKQRYAALWG